MRVRLGYILTAAAIFACSVLPAMGATVTVTSSGSGVYAVQGENMIGVAGIDLSIGYDASSLSSPAVSWGSLVSGALSIANTTVPGTIKIAIIRTDPFSGSGPIAAISFATQTGTGGMTSIAAKLIDSKGGIVPVQAGIAAGAAGGATAASAGASIPGVPFSQSGSAQSPSTAAASSAASPVATGLGTVTLSGDSQPKADLRPAESKGVPAPEGGDVKETPSEQVLPAPVEKPADPVEAADVRQVQTTYAGVLDRFRTYQGERTPEALVGLFAKPVSPFIRQEPEIAVSDGKGTVQVTVDLAAVKGTSANFALTGARLVSLKRGAGADTWVLESLPQGNSLKASVIILTSSSSIEFPLTVVPPAAVSQKPADFAAFLKDSPAKGAKGDLNGDGRHDYLDDFIYAAHYAIQLRAPLKTER